MPTRIHVASVAWPPKITEPWLINESSVPTSSAMGMHRDSDDRESTTGSRRGGDDSPAASTCLSTCRIVPPLRAGGLAFALARVLELGALPVGRLTARPARFVSAGGPSQTEL